MKLAFIFKRRCDWSGDNWTITGGFANHLTALGHPVDCYELDSEEELFLASKNHSQYDAVCLWEAGTIKDSIANIWHKDNFKNTLMMAESGDDPQIFASNLRHTMPADVVLTPDSDALNQYKKLGKNAYWLTHWGDESVWKKCPERDTGKVSSAAGPRPGLWKNVMTQLLTDLPDRFINPRINGGQYMTTQENVHLYDESDIVVQVSSNKEITRRLFEASICGRVVVADRLAVSKRLHDCLAEDEHIVLYDDPEDCVSKVKDLLSDINKRKRIAAAVYEHVLKNHSATARAKQFIDIIKRNK